MFRSVASSFVPVAFTVVALAAQPSAQCLLPDNLAGPCCSLTTASLPSFPPVTLSGTTICFDSCSVGVQQCNLVAIGAPTMVACGEYTASFQTFDCGATPQLKGTLQLQYSRTWDEFPVPGTAMQVWRFLVKVDMNSASTVFGCQVPACLATYATAFYHGYLDYAYDCANGTFENALALYHGCDRYQHDPLLSARPGVFHPNRSFAIVAPSVAANPFLPALGAPTGGPLFAEGMRDVGTGFPPPGACNTTEPVFSGNLTNIASACVCPFALTPVQVTARLVNGQSACGSSFASVNVFPTLPWVHMLSTAIGSWSNASSYPGTEHVWIEEGTFLHTKGCSPPQAFAEIKVGVSTEGGFLAGVGPAGADKFTDLVDNYAVALGAPILPPFLGVAGPSHHLVHVNAP